MKGSSGQLSAANEQELWKKFQLEDDEKSLSVIYSLYFDQLYNYGSRFTADNTIVEDCIQELFIKLIRNRQNLKLSNPSPPKDCLGLNISRMSSVAELSCPLDRMYASPIKEP